MTKIFSGIKIKLENESIDVSKLDEDIDNMDIIIKLEKIIGNKLEAYNLIDLYFDELKKHGIIK
jgi:hypothetical protein